MSDELTPNTKVSLTVAKWVAVLGGVAVAVWTVGIGYSDIRWTLRSLNDRVGAIDARVQQLNPATVRDEARRVCREVTAKQMFGCSCVRAQGSRLSCQCKAREEKDDE